MNFTGWTLRPSGRGNQVHANAALALTLGDFLLAPNVLYQKPLEGPLPSIPDHYSALTNTYFPAIHARNILDDPFVVLDNRELLGLELLLAYDPTPATWLWMWDNDRRENATFAGTVSLAYRHHPTSRDANLFFLETGQIAAFRAAPPARDLWDVNARLIFARRPNAK